MTRTRDNDRPTVAVSMGDPAGVGPEVIVKALADPALRRKARFVIHGLNEPLTYAADAAEIDVDWWRTPQANRRRHFAQDVVVLDYDEYDSPEAAAFVPVVPGPTAAGGRASYRFVCDAVDSALNGFADAVCTAPIAKESWHLAGHRWPGHTELLASLTKSKHHAMMFAGGPLKVALATAHVPLSGLWGALNIGAIFRPIELLHGSLRRDFGIDKPRIFVCGLNPHAGENGLFGDEEKRLIEPALTMAREQGIDARGPFPGDTVFRSALAGECDAVVAMYHDQGLIPVKLLGFHDSVNLTLGLPIVRTSPDHGTAFDLVGKNAADPGSMSAALHMAADLAVIRQRTPAAVPVT